MKHKLAFLLPFCVAIASHAEEAAKDRKNDDMPTGKPDSGVIVAGVAFPSMTGRPDILKPEPIPKGVRYRFAEDGTVVAAADLLKSQLLQEPNAPAALFRDMVMIQPGAWKSLKAYEGIGKKASTPSTHAIPMANKLLTLEGMVIRDKDEIATLGKALREIIKKDGGATVRALKTTEMSKLWVYISFDIEEPVLVVETTNHKHVFVCDFLQDHVVIVEELNALPNGG